MWVQLPCLPLVAKSYVPWTMLCKLFYCLEKITAHSTHPSSLYQNCNWIIIACQFTSSRGECSTITGKCVGLQGHYICIDSLCHSSISCIDEPLLQVNSTVHIYMWWVWRIHTVLKYKATALVFSLFVVISSICLVGPCSYHPCSYAPCSHPCFYAGALFTSWSVVGAVLYITTFLFPFLSHLIVAQWI